MSKQNTLNAWKAGAASFFASRSAQGVMNGNRVVLAAAAACGASDDKPGACGAGDEKKGAMFTASACGAGDETPKPRACGAADEQPKPSACGSSCGAGDGK